MSTNGNDNSARIADLAINALERQLKPGGPEVDVKKILWYLEGLLDAKEAREVERNILNYRAWNDARLDLAREEAALAVDWETQRESREISDALPTMAGGDNDHSVTRTRLALTLLQTSVFWGSWPAISIAIAMLQGDYQFFILIPLLYLIAIAGFVWTLIYARKVGFRMPGTMIEAIVAPLITVPLSVILFELWMIFDESEYASASLLLSVVALPAFVASLFGLIHGFGLRKLLNTTKQSLGLLASHLAINFVFAGFVAVRTIMSIEPIEEADAFLIGVLFGITFKALFVTLFATFLNFARLANSRVREVPLRKIWGCFFAGVTTAAITVAIGMYMDGTPESIRRYYETAVLLFWLWISLGYSLGQKRIGLIILHTLIGFFIDPIIGIFQKRPRRSRSQ